jgi:tetratricopeptide (TPR) repeat protein
MVRLSRIALEHGKNDPEVLATAAFVIGDPGGELKTGLSLVDKALALNPNSVTALLFSGFLRIHAGDAETAIKHLEQAARLSPMEQGADRNNIMSMAYFYTDRYDEAIEFAQRTLRENPLSVPVMRRLITIYGLLDRKSEAREMIRRLHAVAPGLTISKVREYMETTSSRESHVGKAINLVCEGLRRAGLPE